MAYVTLTSRMNNRIAGVATMTGTIPLVDGGHNLIQPVYGPDVAKAIFNL